MWVRRPWGHQERGVQWLRFTDLYGNTEEVHRGTRCRTAIYDKYFREHKDKMIKLLGLDVEGGEPRKQP
jgi:hypothetical protein